jgi:hypothetical protein
MRNIQDIKQMKIDLQWDKLIFSQMQALYKVDSIQEHITQHHQTKNPMFIYILTDKVFLKI